MWSRVMLLVNINNLDRSQRE